MSAQAYSRDMAKLSVAKMLQTIGWNSINTTPLEILTDILVQYLLQISRTANDYANEFGCTEPNLDHIGLAFRDCHVNLVELEEYITFVDFAQPPLPVPKYPISKEDNLNFLKPGSMECLTRPVHIHEHLPPISITEVENDTEGATPVTAKPDEILQDSSTDMDSDNVLFKRPAEVSPSETFKRIRTPSTSETGPEAEQGRPTREISSVMMTTSGFISPAREGRLPDSRTPIVQTPISEPPSPEPVASSPPLPAPAQTVIVVNTTQEQLPTTDDAAVIEQTVHVHVDVVKHEMPELENKDTVQQELTQAAEPAGISSAVAVMHSSGMTLPPTTTPIIKKPKAPRKLDHHSKQRKEKFNFDLGNHHQQQQPHMLLPVPSDHSASTKSKKSGGQTNKDLARQMRKHQQQLLAAQALAHVQPADMDQPMNLSTSAPQKQSQPDSDVTIQHAKVAKAKANRTLAAARRKTEKLNTTITPIPMPAAAKSSAGTTVDKLFNEPDKKKVNILKKISNVRNEAKPAALGKVPQIDDDAQMHPVLPNDVTIELVDMRNNQAQGGVTDDLAVHPIPVKEKRKRKERVSKPRKVPKLMEMSPSNPWEEIEAVERPATKSPDIIHNHAFSKLPPLGRPGLPFPFLPQFSGPGLIPSFPNPLFPNHLLPHHFATARAAALSSMLHHHNAYYADPQDNNNNNNNNDDQQPSTSTGNTGNSGQPYPVIPSVSANKPGRPRKTPSHTITRPPALSSAVSPTVPMPIVTAPAIDASAFHSQIKQGLVSSTTTSPQRTAPDQSCQIVPIRHTTVSPQVSSSSTSAHATTSSSSGIIRGQSTSPNHGVVGSTVTLTPPLIVPVATASTSATSASVTNTPTSTASASIPAGTSSAAAQQEPQPVKLDKKNREHKKDKKDKVKKKNKKDKIKKDKLEKKKLREELKMKLKKEKREKKKEKDMNRGNLSETLPIPKLTLKLGSPPPKPGLDASGTDSAKLTVKPIFLRKEESSGGDDIEKKRESSPELARISPLVTGQPKPKFVQPQSIKDHHNHHQHHHQHAQHYTMDKDAGSVPSTARSDPSAGTAHASTSAVVIKTHHAGPGRPRKLPLPTAPGKQIQQQQPQPHLEVGRVKVSRQQLIAAKLFNKPHTLQSDSQGNEVWICPHCGKQDDGSPMIGCDDCDAWYHWVCVNMQVPPEENEDWYCKNCIKKRMQSSLLPEKKKKRKKKDRKEH